jgi:hypothetical protein
MKKFIGENIINVDNANNVVDYWERNQDDSNILVEFIDFDKVEVSIDEDNYDGTIEDAIESVKDTIFNARLYKTY